MCRPLGAALALVVLLNASGAWAARAPGAASLAREARALEAELGMAAKPSIYFVLDARDSTLLIKAAGLTLKALPITHLTQWGDAVSLRPHALATKSALISPRRPTIRPPEKKADGGEASAAAAAQPLDVLEVTDMPARFQVTLARGLGIAVRPEPQGFFARLGAAADRAAWHLAHPLPALWHRALGRPYTALYVRLAAPDARALYWAVADNAEFLVLPR